jgi:hypothetical protein
VPVTTTDHLSCKCVVPGLHRQRFDLPTPPSNRIPLDEYVPMLVELSVIAEQVLSA